MAKRTSEHIIADLSINFLEEKVLRRGHVLWRVPSGGDYGTDALMQTFSPSTGQRDGVFVEFQLKATKKLTFVAQNKKVTCAVKASHLREWCHIVDYPFILILYDATNERGFWLDIQNYVEEHKIFDDEDSTDTVTLRIPVCNKLTEDAINQFRRMALKTKQALKRIPRAE